MTKFKVEEKVIVRTYPEMPRQWSSDMYALMGQVVTIKRNSMDKFWPYSIKEASRWVWREQDFIPLGGETDPNILFSMRKL